MYPHQPQRKKEIRKERRRRGGKGRGKDRRRKDFPGQRSGNSRTQESGCLSSMGEGYNYLFILFLMSLLKQEKNNNNKLRDRLISTLTLIH